MRAKCYNHIWAWCVLSFGEMCAPISRMPARMYMFTLICIRCERMFDSINMKAIIIHQTQISTKCAEMFRHKTSCCRLIVFRQMRISHRAPKLMLPVYVEGAESGWWLANMRARSNANDGAAIKIPHVCFKVEVRAFVFTAGRPRGCHPIRTTKKRSAQCQREHF